MAQIIGGEIISADARQLYKGMPIGTAVPVDSPVKHHLTEILDPAERTSALWWAKKALSVMEMLIAKEITPIIVGGTGLYIKALTDGIFDSPGESFEIRETLAKRADSGEDLHETLSSIDNEAASKIHPNNTVRIIRALEVYYSTEKTITEHFKSTETLAGDWTFHKFLLVRDRKKLYHRIDQRVISMIDSGWIEETKNLLQNGISPNSPGMEAIGYRHIVRYLKGELDISDLIDRISRETRRYAKRQLTWFRNQKGYEKIDLTETTQEDVVGQIIEYYKSRNFNDVVHDN